LDNPGGRGKFLGIVENAYLDADLFRLLRDPEAHQQLRETIIRRYFATHSARIAKMLRRERPIGLYEEFLRERAAGKVANGDAPDADEDARDTAFSRVVRAAYDYRCAACGLRVFLDDGTILVDAAHIVPFSVSKDDDPRNGMALCRNHHWAMDKLLIAPVPPADRPLWRVSKALDVRIEGQTDLLSLDGKRVIPPRESRYLPKAEALRWRLEHLRKTA
jgi:putative restriction endonuclease